MKHQTPFWRDEAEQRAQPAFNQPGFKWLFKIQVYLLVAIPLLVFLGFLFRYTHPLVAWGWIALVVSLFAYSRIQQKRQKTYQAETSKIQEDARRSVGAAYIGSAIHVAGCPPLERDQPVVIALDDDQLSIFGYDRPVPLVTIPIDKIVDIHTVMYDKERIPHIEVIDNSAQALQLIYENQEQEWTCLFRRMRKIRPVDWYHRIQTARARLSG